MCLLSRPPGLRGSERLEAALPLPMVDTMLGLAPYWRRVRVREYTKLRSLGERAFWTMSIRERRMW